jgi:hypothetical protein
MLRSIIVLGTVAIASSSLAEETTITGNVSSKCSIYTDVAGVYGNPNPDELSTLPADGGVMPVLRYDVSIANYYSAKIAYPIEFTTSPSLTDSLTWTGQVEVATMSDATGMSNYETNKVTYDNVTEYDLTAAGSTWFKVTSGVTYGVDKSLPGGEYKAAVTALCIAN